MLVTAGAGALLLWVGSDDAVQSPPTRLAGPGVALVVDDLRAETDLLAPSGIGSFVLVVRGPEPVFVGEAAPEDLDGYLAGAPYDAVLAADGGLTTRPVPGTQQPPPPTSSEVWTRSAVGDPAKLPLPVTPGSSLVVMRVDARPGVAVDLTVVLRVPGAWRLGWVLMGFGAALLLLAALVLRRSRAHRRAPSHAAAAVGGSDVLPGLGLPSSAPAPVGSSHEAATVVDAASDGPATTADPTDAGDAHDGPPAAAPASATAAEESSRPGVLPGGDGAHPSGTGASTESG